MQQGSPDPEDPLLSTVKKHSPPCTYQEDSCAALLAMIDRVRAIQDKLNKAEFIDQENKALRD
jgi:hypothetical protein